MRRTTKWGRLRVGTLRAGVPRLLRCTRAMSAIHRNSPVARNRSPGAAGAVIARTSRTSTTSSPMRGVPGMSPRSGRLMTWAEPKVSRESRGPNTAPDRIVVSSAGPLVVSTNVQAACSAVVFERR
jgi:hypothetical protein